jgi:hypothetical protein
MQRYFDSRGVARLYEMSYAGACGKLWRTAADFSPLDFSQRYTGNGRVSSTGRSHGSGWPIASRLPSLSLNHAPSSPLPRLG